ncbi:hypothetical protein LTR09_000371 [Extremus antarcticus]|uniref:Uncharacterized protein n=1 Tax=Extremus antarcticus TaxID=702011 RepID=A0AAJ0GJH6_9PEZI|nr:hypothetical protein LTR09_000371 [Extremus antarcticus]
MANVTVTQKHILTVGLTKYLTGNTISSAIDADWTAKVDPATRKQFNNVGFDIDPNDFPESLRDLRQTLHSQEWDGVLIGWCTRGYAERTELFEQVMNVCVDETTRGAKGSRARLIFSTGPTNLAETTLRSFPVLG